MYTILSTHTLDYIEGYIIMGKRIKSREMNKSQRNALRRVLHFIRQRNNYNGCTSVRFNLIDCGPFISVSTDTRRSDCDKHSPRAVTCQESGQFFIGRRGGLQIASYRALPGDHKRHVADMLNARVFS